MFIIGAHLLGSSSVSVSPHKCRAWEQDVIVEFSSHGIITDTSGFLTERIFTILSVSMSNIRLKAWAIHT